MGFPLVSVCCIKRWVPALKEEATSRVIIKTTLLKACNYVWNVYRCKPTPSNKKDAAKDTSFQSTTRGYLFGVPDPQFFPNFRVAVGLAVELNCESTPVSSFSGPGAMETRWDSSFVETSCTWKPHLGAGRVFLLGTKEAWMSRQVHPR